MVMDISVVHYTLRSFEACPVVKDIVLVVPPGYSRDLVSWTSDSGPPSYAIVDGWGMIRGEYRYQTLADDADKLVRHIDVLGGELRNSGGIASFAYEAAHVFQCYP